MKTLTQAKPGILGFTQMIQQQLDKMVLTGKLFRSKLSGQAIWELYLNSFTKENNPMFRDPASSEKNCNNCHNFIKRYGNIIAINEDNKIMTIFDVDTNEEFQQTADSLSGVIKAGIVQDVFFETFDELNSLPYESCSKSNKVFQLGLSKNPKRYTKEEADKFGVVKPDEIRTFNHMHLFIPKAFVDTTGTSVESIMAGYRDAKEVFKRGMKEISEDTLKLVSDLIKQGSLLNGDAHLFKIEQFLPLKQQFDSLPKSEQDNWCWVKSYKLPIAKFRNELIGTLCVELSEGKGLNESVQAWNKRVDPVNYMKATAPITKKQIEEAKKYVEQNGYAESFDRRAATIEDVLVSEILHINAATGKIKEVSVFDKMTPTPSTRHKRNEFEGVEEVTIDKFMKDILPTCTSVEAFLTNFHQSHMVTLTTANNPDSKKIFKWGNNYSWTYDGNLAGKSEIKEAVISKGGNVTGVLRFSMIWNNGISGKDDSDLDAWCQQPDNIKIGYSTGYRKDRGDSLSSCSGQLDLDNTSPNGKLAVENIYFADIKKMKNGVYKFWVNQFSARNSQGFKCEIEFNGETYSYEYNRPVSNNVVIAEVTLKNGEFTIAHKLPATNGEGVSKEIYGLQTNQFHKVKLLCLSPNHWNGEKVGNKHYMFMLEGCKAPGSFRSFHNENLIPDLLEHRKVMEVLGATNSITANGNQLSGLGFNATVRDELIVKLQGTHKRMVKIKF